MKMAELSALAFGRWEGILIAHGANAAHLRNIHGPCPFCGGKDRFRWSDDGVGRWICNQCGKGDGFDYLQRLHGWALRETMSRVSDVVGSVPAQAPKPQDDPQRKIKYMARVWRESVPISPGDPVWAYLTKRTGIEPRSAKGIRCHPALEHSVDKQKHPAMVVQMVDKDGKKAIGIHRTYLTQDGNKASVDPVKMTLGEVGAIRLAGSGIHLGLAEGIETALTASKIFGMPVWAAVCANGMKTWDPPAGVESVVVFGDNDASFTGQAAAYECARRLTALGLSVEVRIPDALGKDWADLGGVA